MANIQMKTLTINGETTFEIIGKSVYDLWLEQGNEGTEEEFLASLKGAKGDEGVGISEIAKTATNGLVDTYTITLSNGETATFTVTNGDKGDDGVGIQSVKQTTTSSEDNGSNIITVTLTNGQTATLEVKNGSKGSNGSDATVTAENVKSALGYTPANEDKINRISEDVFSEVETLLCSGAETTLTLGEDYNVGDTLKFECLTENTDKAEITYEISTESSSESGDDELTEVGSMGVVSITPTNGTNTTDYTTVVIKSDMTSFTVNKYVTVYRIDYRIVADSELSEESINPVQNKIVTEKLNELSGEIDDLPTETVLYTAQTLTEAQKAQARANIGATAGEEVEFADSVEWLNENGDTSKKYLLPDGFIYEYTEKHVTEPHNANTGTINLRPNVNVSMDTALVTESGVLISEPIPFSSDWTASGETVRALSTVTISGIDKLVSKYVSPIGLYYYEADGTFIVYMKASQMASLGKPSNTEDLSLPVSLMIKDINFSNTSWSNVGYVRILLGISTSGDITADDIADVKINCAYYDFEGNVTGWYSTGQQHSNDLATQQNSADISALKERMNTAEADIEELQTAIENVSIVDISTGQKLYAVGDSITYGYGVGGNDYSWVKHVIDINGYDSTNCVNLGQSGLGFNTTSTSENTIADIVDGTDFSGADIVTVALGINDWKNYNARLTAIWEGMEYCFNKIRTDNPCCKIFFVCPFNASIANTTFDTFYCLGYKEGGSNTEVPYNHTLQDFINMMKAKFEEDTFKAFHINVIDMTECPAINRYNITTALMDNLHPTAETHIALGKEIARRIALT